MKVEQLFKGFKKTFFKKNFVYYFDELENINLQNEKPGCEPRSINWFFRFYKNNRVVSLEPSIIFQFYWGLGVVNASKLLFLFYWWVGFESQFINTFIQIYWRVGVRNIEPSIINFYLIEKSGCELWSFYYFIKRAGVLNFDPSIIFFFFLVKGHDCEFLEPGLWTLRRLINQR